MPHNLALFPRRAHDWVADPVGGGSSWCLALPSFKNHDGGARRVRAPRRSAISSPPKFGFAFLKGLRNGSEWREMMVCTSCQHLAWYLMCRGLQGFVKCSESRTKGANYHRGNQWLGRSITITRRHLLKQDGTFERVGLGTNMCM